MLLASLASSAQAGATSHSNTAMIARMIVPLVEPPWRELSALGRLGSRPGRQESENARGLKIRRQNARFLPSFFRRAAAVDTQRNAFDCLTRGRLGGPAHGAPS